MLDASDVLGEHANVIHEPTKEVTMNIQKRVITKTGAALVLAFATLGVIANEHKSYVGLELGQITNKFTDVFEGPTLRAAVDFRFNRNLGLEVAYEFSSGGTAAANFWDFDSTATREFDNINTLGVFGTAEWAVSRRFSFFSKLGVSRGTADYNIPDVFTGPITGSLTETNVVVILGVAVPTRHSYDYTFALKENFSANFFGLGDSFDSSTVCVGLRRRW